MWNEMLLYTYNYYKEQTNYSVQQQIKDYMHLE